MRAHCATLQNGSAVSGLASTGSRALTPFATLGLAGRDAALRRPRTAQRAIPTKIVPLAIADPAGDNRPVDVGNLIRSSEHPCEAKSMKRGFSSSRFDWLTETGCTLGRFYFRHDEAEFPTASQTVCNLRTSRGSRAADRASLDALRPLNNLVKIKDQHELAFIRETPAPWARPVSTEGRARTFSRSTRTGTEAENILATHRRIFCRQRRRPKETSAAIA